MRLPTPLIASSVLTLVMLGACATESPQKEPTPPPQEESSGSSSGSGTPSPTTTPAPAPTAPPPAPASTATPAGGSPAQTPDERRAAIDRRLSDSLGTFDEELRKEQERVAQERDAREAAAAGTAQTEAEEATKEADEGEGEEAGSAGTENPPVAGTEAKTGDSTARPGDLKSDKDRADTTSSGAASGTGAGAANIPDGSDDDIIARRLRKAAEQETDPELKEKLWKEYIEYKKNAGS
jgi:hypothetical protein